jgi:hypothetical protein
MMNLSRNVSAMALTVSAMMSGLGCSQQPVGSKLADSAHFEPAPEAAERSSVESRLKRYVGQTEFLNLAQSHFGGPIMARAASAESAKAEGGAERAIQEADVFKVGKPGSKLLFLLNNYRGLQVVSFEKGADKPELIGRVEATGNYPDTMYFDSANNRLVVVERMWVDDQGNNSGWQEQTSRIVVYDVSTPSKPVISQKLEFKGNAADSRLVGDVLYVAVSHSENNRWQPQDNKPRGIVYSFKLGTEISEVAQKQLALPTYRENMNIVEVANADGSFNYYLVAVLSNSSWGWWWDRSSAVEVVDITSASGEITPVMIAPVKGNINERSSTSIKNKTLIVVSNYMSTEGQGLQRIAVETYKFPTSKKDMLSSDEVKFRKMYIEREINKLKSAGASEAELKAKRAALESDELLGIKGKFEQTEAGNTEKIMPDSTVTVGDTNGQHASLQDVRFAGDLLYAFWVPANMVDPLDVFDISKPEQGVAHLGHLEFEGWIQRSFALEHKGRKFVLGLGTIVPSVNNEEGRRHPQARLIEIKQLRNGKLKAVDVADMTFKDSNVWAQLNGEDKFVELRMTNTETGEGSILFRVDMWSESKYTSGGKLVGFNLSNADEGDVFTEGGLLAAEWGWLKRVFTNSEISKINTFSDEQLLVYNTETGGSAAEVFNAIGSLELARNVVGYVTLNPKTGVQIVSKGQEYYWGNQESNATTELRQVEMFSSDAELPEVVSVVTLKGQFESSLKIGTNLIVSTRETKSVETQVEGETVKSQVAIHTLSLIEEKDGKLAVKSQVSFEAAPEEEFGGGFERTIGRRWYNHEKLELSTLADGTVLATVGKTLYVVRTEAQLVAQQLTTQSCELSNAAQAAVSVNAGRVFMKYTQLVNEKGEVVDPATLNQRETREAAPYAAHFVSELSAVAGTAQPTFACGTKINVPGELMKVTASGLVLTQDVRLMDRVRKERRWEGSEEAHVYYENLTKQVLASLKPAGADKVELVDMYDPAGDSENRWSSSINSMQSLSNDRYVFVEAKDYENHDTTYTFSVLSFDPSGRILKQSRLVELAIAGGVHITQIFESDSGFGTIVQSGRKAQVVLWSQDFKFNLIPKLSRVLPNTESVAAEVVVLPGYSWYGYGDRAAIDVDLDNGILNFAQGLYGVAQVWVK